METLAPASACPGLVEICLPDAATRWGPLPSATPATRLETPSPRFAQREGSASLARPRGVVSRCARIALTVATLAQLLVRTAASASIPPPIKTGAVARCRAHVPQG